MWRCRATPACRGGGRDSRWGWPIVCRRPAHRLPETGSNDSPRGRLPTTQKTATDQALPAIWPFALSALWMHPSPHGTDAARDKRRGRPNAGGTGLAGFYADVLWHRPGSARRPLQAFGNHLHWDNDARAQERFRAWATGRTGYPLVDAGMRQLLTEGWMHNRVRMVAASFLVKDLHVDWRLGARWFMWHLVDGDLASNQHGWQWVAGTGTDAAPFHRVLNPILQQRRFDPDGAYVRRYLGEPGPLAWLGSGPGAVGNGCPIRSSITRSNGAKRSRASTSHARKRPPRWPTGADRSRCRGMTCPVFDDLPYLVKLSVSVPIRGAYAGTAVPDDVGYESVETRHSVRGS